MESNLNMSNMPQMDSILRVEEMRENKLFPIKISLKRRLGHCHEIVIRVGGREGWRAMLLCDIYSHRRHNSLSPFSRTSLPGPAAASYMPTTSTQQLQSLSLPCIGNNNWKQQYLLEGFGEIDSVRNTRISIAKCVGLFWPFPFKILIETSGPRRLGGGKCGEVELSQYGQQMSYPFPTSSDRRLDRFFQQHFPAPAALAAATAIDTRFLPGSPARAAYASAIATTSNNTNNTSENGQFRRDHYLSYGRHNNTNTSAAMKMTTASRPETLVPFNRRKTTEQILIDLVPNSGYFSYQSIAGGLGGSGASGGSYTAAPTAPLIPPSSDQIPLYQMPTGPNPMITGTGTMVPLDLLKNRLPARAVSIVDSVFASVLLVFHGLTLMVQELPEDRASADNNWLLPHIPMTPGELNITGYMEVIAWIGILSVNFLQLLVAVSLFNSTDKTCESLKAFEASRVWLKTCIFIIIILLIKLCILYFMYEMGMKAYGTIVYSMLELIFHAAGLVVIIRFFDEIKRNNPIASRIFYQSDENSSPKRNNVSDAVWF